MGQVSKMMLFIGIVGVLLTLAVNLYASFGLHRGAAAFFSSPWWSRWFPIYMVMASAAFIGAVLRTSVK